MHTWGCIWYMVKPEPHRSKESPLVRTRAWSVKRNHRVLSVSAVAFFLAYIKQQCASQWIVFEVVKCGGVRIMYREVTKLLHLWRWPGSPWRICRARWEQRVGPVGRIKNIVILFPLSHQVPAWILGLNSSQPQFLCWLHHIYPDCIVRV